MEIILLATSVVALGVAGFAVWQISAYRKKINALVPEQAGAGLDEVLNKLENYQKITGRLEEIENRLNNSVSKVGVIRYNPFGDTGGDLSFALALLNDNLDGFVLTSMHSREGTRVYSKPITNGGSKYSLSGEEKEAISRAINNKEEAHV